MKREWLLFKVDFSKLLIKYIEAIEDDDVGLVEMIENKSEEHRRIVDVLGMVYLSLSRESLIY